MNDLLLYFYIWHSQAHKALTSAISGLGAGETTIMTPCLFALALGALHALTPGHGKAVVISYFLGREAKLLAGIVAGLKIAAGHVLLAAILVAIFGAVVSVMGKPAGAAALLQSFAYFIIAASGAWLLYKSLWSSKQAVHNDHEHSHAHHHHVPTLAGLIPCPLTMILLTYALATTSLAVSIVLLVPLGVGIAATIALFGLVAIIARKLIVAPINAEGSWHARLTKILEVGSSTVIFAIGLALLLGVTG